MLSKLRLNQQRHHPFPVALLVLSIFFFVSCVPTEPAQVPATTSLVSPTLTPAPPSLKVELSSPLPSVTARGPDLVASDPATVKLASGDLQLIEFIRFTWSTCRFMAPIVHGLEAEYYGRVHFTYLDANDPDTREFQRALGFSVQPEFYLLDAEGTVLYRWFGYVEADAFREQLELYVGD